MLGSETAELLQTASLMFSTFSRAFGISERCVQRLENSFRQFSRCGAQALIVSNSGRWPDRGNSILSMSILIVRSLWRLQSNPNLMKMELILELKVGRQKEAKCLVKPVYLSQND